MEAEEFPDISLKHEVVAVPTFILMKVRCGPTDGGLPSSLLFQGGKVVDRVDGAHVPELSKKTALHSDLVAPPPPPETGPTHTTPPEVGCYPYD